MKLISLPLFKCWFEGDCRLFWAIELWLSCQGVEPILLLLRLGHGDHEGVTHDPEHQDRRGAKIHCVGT